MSGWELAGWGVAILVWFVLAMLLIGLVRRVGRAVERERERQRIENFLNDMAEKINEEVVGHR